MQTELALRAGEEGAWVLVLPPCKREEGKGRRGFMPIPLRIIFRPVDPSMPLRRLPLWRVSAPVVLTQKVALGFLKTVHRHLVPHPEPTMAPP